MGQAQSEVTRKPRRERRWLTTLKRLFNNRVAVVAGIVLVIFILAAIFAPILTPYTYDGMDLAIKNQGPSWAHLLGTDEYGRDILSRIMYGGRYSLTLSIAAVLVALVIGVVWGAIAGYFGNLVDNILMRILDVIQAVPDLILTIAISAALGSGIYNTLLALALSRIANFARILRSSVLSVKESDYVEAAEAIGCGRVRRIVRYILPNSWTPLIVQATLQVASIMLSLASLSYIGLGIQAPLPEWGTMLSNARNVLLDYPTQLLFPGLAIAICVLCFNLLGDGLRDALDPKLRR